MSRPSGQLALKVAPRHSDKGCIAYSIEDWRSGPRPRCLVVLPAYNAERWIGRCLASLDENVEPHDVLVVDDGSRTPGRDFIAGAANRVLVTLHENVGLISVLNFAAEFCLQEGYEFYVRQDADDLSRHDRLVKQRILADETGAALVTSRARVVDESGNLLWRSPPAVPPRRVRSALSYKNPFFHSSWFLPTRTLRRVGLYSPEFPGAEDYEFLVRIARIGDIVTSNEELIDYTVRSGSILSASRTPGISVMRARAKHLDWLSLAGWYGLARGASALVAPRSLKVWARSKLAARTPVS